MTAKRGVPEFGPGDTVKVMVKVIEGDSVRTQLGGRAFPSMPLEAALLNLIDRTP